MFTKSILTAAAIALVAGLGSASAGEQFTSLVGIDAEVMSSQSMGEVRGGENHTPGVITTIGVMNQDVGGNSTFARLGFIKAIEQINDLNKDPLTLICRTC